MSAPAASSFPLSALHARLPSATKPKTANNNIRSARGSMPGALAAAQAQRNVNVDEKSRRRERELSAGSCKRRCEKPTAAPCQGRDL